MAGTVARLGPIRTSARRAAATSGMLAAAGPALSNASRSRKTSVSIEERACGPRGPLARSVAPHRLNNTGRVLLPAAVVPVPALPTQTASGAALQRWKKSCFEGHVCLPTTAARGASRRRRAAPGSGGAASARPLLLLHAHRGLHPAPRPQSPTPNPHRPAPAQSQRAPRRLQLRCSS